MYQEEADSTFTHWGKVYNLNWFLSRAQDELPKKSVEVRRIAHWVTGQELDPDRVSRADVKTPILVTKDRRVGLVILDGTHRTARALELHLTTLPARFIPDSWFDDPKGWAK